MKYFSNLWTFLELMNIFLIHEHCFSTKDILNNSWTFVKAIIFFEICEHFLNPWTFFGCPNFFRSIEKPKPAAAVFLEGRPSWWKKKAKQPLFGSTALENSLSKVCLPQIRVSYTAFLLHSVDLSHRAEASVRWTGPAHLTRTERAVDPFFRTFYKVP